MFQTAQIKSGNTSRNRYENKGDYHWLFFFFSFLFGMILLNGEREQTNSLSQENKDHFSKNKIRPRQPEGERQT